VSGTFSYTVTVKDSAGNTGTVELLGNGGPAGDLHLRGHQRRAGYGYHARDDDGRRRRGWTLYSHGHGPAGRAAMAGQRYDFRTPTVSGTFSYTVTVKDSAGNTGTVNCSVQ